MSVQTGPLILCMLGSLVNTKCVCDLFYRKKPLCLTKCRKSYTAFVARIEAYLRE